MSNSCESKVLYTDYTALFKRFIFHFRGSKLIKIKQIVTTPHQLIS